MLICSPILDCVRMVKEFRSSYIRYEVDYIRRNPLYNHVVCISIPVGVKVKISLKSAITTVASELSKASLV